MKKRILLWSIRVLAVLVLAAAAYRFGKSWNYALFLQPLSQIETDQRVIALTFDDGPSPRRTLPLLDVLDKHHIKATFFMIGKHIEEHPEIAKEVVARGHMVGNHSYTHPKMVLKSPQFVREEITKTSQLLRDIGSDDYTYFRPPHTFKLVVLPLVLKSLGMTLVTGSYDPTSQYTVPYPKDTVAQEVIEHAEPGGIIFLHDGRDDGVDLFAQTVDTIITKLKADGYQFVTITGEK